MDRADACAVLGVEAGAGALAIKRAHRRIARSAHPDVGGSAERMREVNEAAAVLLADIGRGRDPAQTVRDRHDRSRATTEPAPARPAQSESRHRFVAHDVASFVIEALPAEAFEALLVVSTWLGEVVADEPPYQLDVVLAEPLACWCRLDLVPDAGASTVALTLQRLEPGADLPDIDTVRDVWVAALNELGDGDRSTP